MGQLNLADWLTTEQVARQARCGRMTVHRALIAGLLVYVPTRLGRLVEPHSAEEFAKARMARRRREEACKG